jgi:hypothetical protein
VDEEEGVGKEVEVEDTRGRVSSSSALPCSAVLCLPVSSSLLTAQQLPSARVVLVPYAFFKRWPSSHSITSKVARVLKAAAYVLYVHKEF